jgi:hypothetical protein
MPPALSNPANTFPRRPSKRSGGGITGLEKGSELQARFSRRFREGLHAAVISVPAAIEGHLSNSLHPRPFGENLTDDRRRRPVAADLELVHNGLIQAARRTDRPAALVIDQLGADVLQAAENAQPRPLGSTEHPAANSSLPPLSTHNLQYRRLHCLTTVTLMRRRRRRRRPCQPSA